MTEFFKQSSERSVAVFITLLVAIVVGLLVRRALISLVKHGHLSPQMGGRMRGVLRWFLGAALVMALLQQTGVFRQAWALVSAAAAALAVGFVASWSVLSNATASVLILTFKPFRIGDRIMVREQDKIWAEGVVSDLSLMFVTITTDDGELEHFPANMIFQRVVRVLGESTLPSAPGTFFERHSTFTVPAPPPPEPPKDQRP